MEIKKFNGTFLPNNKSDNEVDFLRIDNNKVRLVPENLQAKFKSLGWLDVSGCGLEKISQTDLFGLEHLVIVNFNNNNLTSLPDDLFAGTRKLHTINFNDNKLEFLSSKLLKPLEYTLIWAGFRRNVKINECYNDATRKDLRRFLAIIDRDCIPPELEGQD